MKQRIKALRALLSAYQPACDQEASHLLRMRTLADCDGDPLSRDHFKPGHFTASAFVLSPDSRRVLLVLHRKLGRWLQPGGHIDAEDRDLLAAACREVVEETGVTELTEVSAGVFDLDIHPIPARGTEPAHEHFDVRFLLRADSEAIVRNDESHDAAWVGFDELAERMHDPCEARVVSKLQRLDRILQKQS